MRCPCTVALALVALAAMTSGCLTGPAAELELARAGASHYEIVVDPAAAQAAREGAQELQRLMKAVAGAELPIVATASAERRQIVIGTHPQATAAGVTAEGLAADGFRLRAVAGNLYLVGEDRDRGEFFQLNNNESSHGGSYFAVLELAERYLGVRWFMPGPLGEEAPPRVRIAVPAELDETLQPRFAARSIDATMGSISPRHMEALAAKNAKLRKEGHPASEYYDATSIGDAVRWGRHLRLGSTLQLDVGHAWYCYVPATAPNSFSAQAYGESHPEYFALRAGQRANRYRGTSHGGQLCVSNPEVAKVYAANVVAYAKRTGVRSFSLSDNDGGEHCECANCRAWDLTTDADGKPVLTDRLARFANAVASHVRAELPDANFGWYAYHDTRLPPQKAKLDPAIIVSDVYNFLPALYYSPGPRQMLEDDLRGWRRQSQRVVLTTYYTGYGFWSLPWSTLEVQDGIVKMMAQYPSSAGLRMCYAESRDSAPMGMLGADPWVLSRLLWQPELSAEALAREFYLGAFGPVAGPLIETYYRRLAQAMAREIARHPVPGRHASGHAFTPAMVTAAYGGERAACSALIAQATAAVAASPERYRWRVDRVARGWRLAELTLDALAAATAARQAPAATRAAAWSKAVDLGQQRQTLIADPASRFALASCSVDNLDIFIPLGIVKELPANEALRLAVPTLRDATLTLDGKLAEPAWSHAAATAPFRENRQGGTPLAATQARLFATPAGLAVAFQCQEPKMAELSVNDDPLQLWSGDVVELFLMPTAATDSYVQLSVNPNGIGKPIVKRGDRGVDLKWQPAWQYAASKGADGWTVELLIPWTALDLPGPPPPGSEWYANFFRERYTDQAELSGWSPTGGSFAIPGKFGRLHFAP